MAGILGASEEVTEEPKKRGYQPGVDNHRYKIPADEIPDFDQETGEVIDQKSENGQIDMLEGEDF